MVVSLMSVLKAEAAGPNGFAIADNCHTRGPSPRAELRSMLERSINLIWRSIAHSWIIYLMVQPKRLWKISNLPKPFGLYYQIDNSRMGSAPSNKVYTTLKHATQFCCRRGSAGATVICYCKTVGSSRFRLEHGHQRDNHESLHL